VRWTGSVRWMLEQGVNRFVEMGPNDVLTKLLRRIDRQATGINVGDAATVRGLKH
jgi:[acyl-carrier-protein] S-malonyltransferase